MWCWEDWEEGKGDRLGGIGWGWEEEKEGKRRVLEGRRGRRRGKEREGIEDRSEEKGRRV